VSEENYPKVKLIGFRVRGSGFRVQGSGFRVRGSGVRVQGSGFRVRGSGVRVQGSGFRVGTARRRSTRARRRSTIPRKAPSSANSPRRQHPPVSQILRVDSFKTEEYPGASEEHYPKVGREREFFIDNLLVQIHLIIENNLSALALRHGTLNSLSW